MRKNWGKPEVLNSEHTVHTISRKKKNLAKIQTRRLASLIVRSSAAASLMLILSYGAALVQLSPTLMAETNQSCSETPLQSPSNSVGTSSVVSRTSSILSGNAALTNPCSVRPSTKESRVGDFPVKISSSVTPKL
jgi:hypothetical protein